MYVSRGRTAVQIPSKDARPVLAAGKGFSCEWGDVRDPEFARAGAITIPPYHYIHICKAADMPAEAVPLPAASDHSIETCILLFRNSYI